MIKRFFCSTITLAIPFIIFAGTMSDENLKSYDPYLADKDGFDSLFVNPAGIAHQTEIFSLTAEAGTWGDLDNYKLLKDNVADFHSMMNGTVTESNIAQFLPMMANEIDESTLNMILEDTTFSENTTLTEAQDPANWENIAQVDLEKIATNMNDSELQRIIMDQFDGINYSLAWETRFGTLIRGIGLGFYCNTYLLYSLGAQGIQDIFFETGAIAGYGFDLDHFSIGFSGKFALLLADDPTKPFSIQQDFTTQQILYGYAWGLDASLIWEPIDSLRFGFVLNDFVGSKTKQKDMARGTIQNILDGNIDTPQSGYSFALDMSLGLSWQPKWHKVQPKVSIDFYDFIGMIRSLEDNYSGLEEYYLSKTPIIFRHFRAGASIRFLGYLDLATSYYMEYLTWSLGFNIATFELFVEFKAKHDFSHIGADMMLKVKF